MAHVLIKIDQHIATKNNIHFSCLIWHRRQDASGKIETWINEIAGASKEQAQGIGQLNIAVLQIDKVTQQNAAGAEESHASSMDLRQQTVELNTIVQRLSALEKGNAMQSGQSLVHQGGAGTALPEPDHKDDEWA